MAKLTTLEADFETRFVQLIELSAKQAFWSQYSVQIDEPNLSATTTIVEVPKELPKVSMELFTSFDQYLIDEVTEVQNVFKQMELAVEQHREEKQKFQNKMEHVLQENDRLLTQALSVDIVNVVVHDNVMSDCLNVDVCVHYVTIESELKKDFIKKECYETLLQQYHTLEKHCISLEVDNQLKKEIFQKNTLSSSGSAPTFAEFFEINELKAQAQEKDTVILQLKEKLHSLKGDVTERNVKREAEDIETLNIELDHKFFENRSRWLLRNRSSQFFENRSRRLLRNRSSQFFENQSRRFLRNRSSQTMATTIEQQVGLDEALVPSTKRNSGQQLMFINTPSDSKWTPELSIWKHLGRCCISVLGNIDYAFLIWEDFVYQVEHKNQKKSNEMYYPRFTKVIIHHFMMMKPSILRRNKVNWHYVRDDILFSTIKVVSRHQNTQQYGAILPIELTTEDIRNTKAYKEYYACATGEAAPKPKVSVRRKIGGSDSSTTPPTAIASPRPITTVAAAPRRTAAAKGKQPARATSPTEPSEIERTEAEQLKIVLRMSRQETHISHHGGSSTDEGTDVDDQDKGRDDNEDEEESFDPIPRTPEDSEDDGNADLTKIELKKIFIEKMEGNKSIQRSDERWNLYKALVDAYDADKTILESYGDTAILKRRRGDDDDQEGPSAGSDRGSKRRREGGEPKSASTPSEPATKSASRSTTRTQSRQMSASESAFAEEPVQTTCQMDEPPHLVFEIGAEDQPIVQTSQHPEWFSQPRKPPTPDHDWNKTLPAIQGSAQTWINELVKQADSRSSFNELLDTPIDFSNFIMNRLGVDTLTPELLARPTYKLMRGLCTSLTELEYHLEEVYKATTNQLDWVNPEGQQYPHNLLQPLPLIPDKRGRRVIPFAHFINNDLEYLRGGASSRKYTTSVTKTKAADYGHIKWIEDLVPRTMWIQEPLNYDKHALWGVSHWGQKRQQFYGFAVNRESALDVYSERRIIDVTDLKIMEWHNYKHLDWIL
nr:hypothetical protein [Tanacetum cinerariifolium]